MYVRLSVGGSNKPKWLIYEISQDGDLSLLLPELNPGSPQPRYRSGTLALPNSGFEGTKPILAGLAAVTTVSTCTYGSCRSRLAWRT